MRELLLSSYGKVFENELLDEIIEVSQVVDFKQGDILIDYGQFVKGFPLLLSGAIKVMREDYDSGELLLYYLERGDACAMSMTCCVGEKKSEIRAIGEIAGVILMIPVHKLIEWVAKYKSWVTFVFDSYNNRFNELLNAVDTLAFMDTKARLLNYLFENSKIENNVIINKTHQEIASDLNTSRVVVSRLLKVLEIEDRIKLNRNSVEILL